MAYSNEKEMYPDVVNWLKSFLVDRTKGQQVIVRDTSSRPLKRVMEDENLVPANRPEWLTFNIRVDVCGFLVDKNQHVDFVLVECKKNRISLGDVSQLLGYSRVVLPVLSIILSPKGMSDDVSILLKTYNRQDVLVYHQPMGELERMLFVATWHQERQSIDFETLLPSGRQMI